MYTTGRGLPTPALHPFLVAASRALLRRFSELSPVYWHGTGHPRR